MAHYNRGNALKDQNRAADAVAAYDQALALKPDLIQAWHNRGSALLDLKRLDEAVASFDRVLAIHPGVAQSWNNRAIALAGLKHWDEALASYDRALALDRNFAQGWNNRGLALHAMGRLGEALDSFDRALTLDPGIEGVWLNRGNVLRDLRRGAQAVESYDRALAIQPRNAQTWTNRGIALRDIKRIDEALASYSQALAIQPDQAEMFYTRGLVTWVEKKDYESALRDLTRAVELDPDCPYALGGLLMVRLYGGDWRGLEALVAQIDEGVRAGKPVIEPFVYQAVSQSPADLQACSIIHAQHRYPAQLPLAQVARAPSKIRIGYVSGEFREQATAYLMAGVYEQHDKTRFEIVAFDNGGSDNSAMRARLEKAFDKFVDISVLSDRDAALRVQAEKIDILVNLNGYFGDHRMGVFAWRPAPLQVNYLGFPATLGAPYMDYILADACVIPENEKRFYTEQVAWLPGSYQANDNRRALAADSPGREACALPADAFVFCNFNTSYKLTPPAFASWMRILKAVPGSVLWLLEGIPAFHEHLRREAEAHGVAGTRLIFAPMTDLPQHLARLALADLFLDALPYNAHTTASDALWAGVPLVTCRGRAFPGRVAASLLDAIGLAELICENLQDYESLAVALAGDPVRLRALREELARNRGATALFDTEAFTRKLEAAYISMMR